MSDSAWREEIVPKIRQLQIAVGALVAACAAFLTVVLVIDVGIPEGDLPILSYTSLFFLVFVLIARAIARSVMISSGCRKIARNTWQPPQQSSSSMKGFLGKTGDAGKLWIVYMTATFVSAVLLEGAAFLILVAYLTEGAPWILVVAVLLIFGVALQIPTRDRAIDWIEEQLMRIDQQRQFAA